MKKFIAFFSIIVFLLAFSSCKKRQTELEKQGYVFVESGNWYEKNGKNKHELIINLTQSSELIKKSYSINSNINKIVFIGDPQIVYVDFNIVVNSRNNSLDIELQNFNYKAPTEQVGLDASNVVGEQEINLLINGSSSITGGKGKNGDAGVSYNYNTAVEKQQAQNGGDGQKGHDGYDAICANKLYISINEYSKLTLNGGAAGNGGIGGNGQGSKYKGIGQAGHAGRGGNGGNGGNAIVVKESLNIENKGECELIGGKGGNGANGGHGGENKDTGILERADHGGNGGSGGSGGNGGAAIYATSSNLEIKTTDNLIKVKSGNGGNGGNGGDGGSSCKNEGQSSKGGNPGAAGSGGNGGNSGKIFILCNIVATEETSNGGLGGKAGNPGYNPEKGYGTSGSNGLNGTGV